LTNGLRPATYMPAMNRNFNLLLALLALPHLLSGTAG
jgi:hypothetical protein